MELDKRCLTIQEKIHAVYSEIDEDIEELVAAASEETHVLFVSDHDFGPLNGIFSVNSWLCELGLRCCDEQGMKKTLSCKKPVVAVKHGFRKLVPEGPRKAVKPVGRKGPVRIPDKADHLFRVKTITLFIPLWRPQRRGAE